MMRKFISFISFLLFLSLGLFVSSCKKKPAPQTKTAFEVSLTNQDSLEVIHLIDQFFQYAESGDATSAAGMLVKLDNRDVYSEPQLLDNEELKDMVSLLKSLPIKSHRIDYLKFSETYENEAKVTAVIMPAHDNVPEVKTVFYFKPIVYLGKWKLSVIDSHSDDKTIIDKDKKDSMESEYATEMRHKEQH